MARWSSGLGVGAATAQYCYTGEVIYLVVGDNQFRIDEALARFGDQREQYDGRELTRESLMNALYGMSLFGGETTVVVDTLSQQKALWEALPDIITAAGQGVTLTAPLASDMVRRAVRTDATSNKPIIDQQLLATAIMQLRSAAAVTPELVDTVLAPSAYENVFNLLGTALDGRSDEVARQVATMRQSEEAYMVLGLLASQLSQLAALVLAGPRRSIDEVAKATGAHPFALRSMQKYATRLNTKQLAYYVELLQGADTQIKTSSTDPWTAIDIALTKIAFDK